MALGMKDPDGNEIELIPSGQRGVKQIEIHIGVSDVRAFDGTVTLQQPQLTPRAERRSAHQLLALLGGEQRPDGQAIVRAQWQASAQALTQLLGSLPPGEIFVQETPSLRRMAAEWPPAAERLARQ